MNLTMTTRDTNVDDLGSAFAARNTTRMLDDVKKTQRMTRPPRPTLPSQSRTSMLEPSTPVRPESPDAERPESPAAERPERPAAERPERPALVSARAAETTVGDSRDPAASVRDIVAAVDRVGNLLYLHTTPQERARIRAATCGSSNFEHAMVTQPTTTAMYWILLMVMAIAATMTVPKMFTSHHCHKQQALPTNPRCDGTIEQLMSFV